MKDFSIAKEAFDGNVNENKRGSSCCVFALIDHTADFIVDFKSAQLAKSFFLMARDPQDRPPSNGRVANI